MGKVKESERKRIIESAGHYLSDQEDGDLYDAYVKLLLASEKGMGDEAADNIVNVWEPLVLRTSVDEMIRLIEDGKPEYPEVLKNIDWSELRAQKSVLLAVIDELEKKKDIRFEELDGILNLIDSIQDFAVDEMGIPEMSVFDFEDEEKREESTPEENFARTNAEIIFQMRIEGEGLYTDPEMSKEFIESIVDDRYHADLIKDAIRRDILNDVRVNPDNFDRDADGNLTYSADMQDYGFYIEEYCWEQFKQRSCKYKVWVEVERIVVDKDGTEIEYADEECPIGIAYRDTLPEAVKLQELIENSFGEI
jgi:hypothetical protein